MQGASDHGVSEALYLPDPDENGIELYADRPREHWPAPGPGARVGMFTAPLDVEDLLRAAPGPEPPRHAGPGLTLGHVHLHVGGRARGAALLPRRDRVRADGRAARRRLRVGGRLPPSPRPQQLARPGRAAGPGRRRGPQALDAAPRRPGRARRVRASASRRPACRPRSATRACWCATPPAPPWCWRPRPRARRAAQPRRRGRSSRRASRSRAARGRRWRGRASPG